MNRPVMKALLPLVLFLLLQACVSAQSWEATHLLQDIEAGFGPSTLKNTTPTPTRSSESYTIEGRANLADVYHPNRPPGGALLLVPGFTPDGKDDPRVVALATTLARARFLVMVPEVPGSRERRVRLEDKRTITDALRHLRASRPEVAARTTGAVAISYAVGLAVLAALELDEAMRPHFLVGLGGYHDTRAVVTYATTGRYRLPGSGRWHEGYPLAAAKWIFLATNAAVLEDDADRRRLQDLGEDCFEGCAPDVAALEQTLGPQGRALLALITNRDPARVPALISALPAAVRAQMAELSLAGRDLRALKGRLILIHGRADPLIPYSESMALARAVPSSELFLVDGFSHITPQGLDWGGQLQLVSAVQAVLARRTLPEP